MPISSRNNPDKTTPGMHPLGVCALFIGALLAPVDYFIVNLALPLIEHGLHTQASVLGMVISAYALAYAVWLIPGGQLGDRYGRKRIFLTGMALFVLSSILCGIAPTIFILIGGRFLQGLSAATFLPQVLATIRTVFPLDKQTRLISWYGFVFGVGAIVGQIGGGLLVSLNIADTSWRAIFFINVPIGLTALILTHIYGVENSTEKPPSLDSLGCILIVCTATAILLPLSLESSYHHPSWCIYLFITGIILAIMTILIEKSRGDNALINIKLLTDPIVSRGLMIGFLFYTDSIFFLGFSFYTQEGLQWNALQSALLFLPFSLGFIANPLGMPPMIARYSKQALPLAFCIIITGFSLLCISLTIHDKPGFLFTLGLIIAGLGHGCVLASLTRTVLAAVDKEYAGKISSMLIFAMQLGSATGVAAFGTVMFTIAHEKNDLHNLAIGFLAGLLCLEIALTISFLVSLSIKNMIRDSTPVITPSKQR